MTQQNNQKLLRLNPSAMPYLAQCKCWERLPAPPTDAMLRGTYLDSIVRSWLENPRMKFGEVWEHHTSLPGADIEAAQWAKDTIRQIAGSSMLFYKKANCKIKMNLPIQGTILSGEMDAFCEGQVFDLKSGKKRDYWWQMLPYAIYSLNSSPELDEVKAHLIYCDLREVETKTYERQEANDQFIRFTVQWYDPRKRPTPGACCDNCRFRDAEGGCRYSAKRV